ncbi:unnamed protein product [Tetraodon nigroviridis]|uniref:(spotted green pufferfish) hypothetical protein n=1 Tax=Tetraodon nigroviridis TaxID=99883 RepID=Q4S8G3_TETNG|nr:unnamed protein product [Tetraodon nigroviridis]
MAKVWTHQGRVSFSEWQRWAVQIYLEGKKKESRKGEESSGRKRDVGEDALNINRDGSLKKKECGPGRTLPPQWWCSSNINSKDKYY